LVVIPRLAVFFQWSVERGKFPLNNKLRDNGLIPVSWPGIHALRHQKAVVDRFVLMTATGGRVAHEIVSKARVNCLRSSTLLSLVWPSVASKQHIFRHCGPRCPLRPRLTFTRLPTLLYIYLGYFCGDQRRARRRRALITCQVAELAFRGSTHATMARTTLEYASLEHASKWVYDPLKCFLLTFKGGRTCHRRLAFRNQSQARYAYSLSSLLNQHSVQGKNVSKTTATAASSYDELKEKRAWDAAIAPAKSLPMQVFMLYMSGGGVQVFSMGIVFMLLFSPFKAIAGINQCTLPSSRLYCSNLLQPLPNLPHPRHQTPRASALCRCRNWSSFFVTC